MLQINPMMPKMSEYVRAMNIPHKAPQSRQSRPLFFFMAKKPPKNADMYIVKNEMGESNECGFSFARPMIEKTIKNANITIIEINKPNTEEINIPLLELCFFSDALFFIKYSSNFLL